MYTVSELKKKEEEALAQGLGTREEILARRQELITTGQVKPDVITQNQTQTQSQPQITSTQPEDNSNKGGLFSAMGEWGKGAVDKVSRFLAPATMNIAQDVGQSLYVGGNEFKQANAGVQAYQQQLQDLAKRAAQTTDPVVKQKLLDIIRKGLAESQRIGSELGATGTEGFSKDVNKNPLERGLASGTELATTFMVPSVGKGGTAVSRIASMAGQGAASSGLRTLTSTEDMTPEERVKKSLTSAAIGGVTTGGLQAAGEWATAAKAANQKAGQAIGKKGSEVRQSVRGIREKGIYGAEKVAKENADLDAMGIRGNTDQQWRQVPNKFRETEAKIQKLATDNPNVTADVEEIEKGFKKSLESSLRTKDITNKQAQLEVTSYLDTLKKAVGGTSDTKKINLTQLRELKKIVNEDYGAVQKVLDSNGTLNPRQKVIHAAWDSIDEAVTTASTEMKKLLGQESTLYRTVNQLESARFNPPTLRAAGTSIPGPVTGWLKDTSGRLIQTAGKAVENLPVIRPEPILPLVAPIVSGTVNPSTENNIQKQNQPAQDQGSQNNPPSDFYHLPDFTVKAQESQNVLPPIELGQQQPQQPQVKYRTGYSPDQLYKAYQQALAENNTGAANQLKTFYDDELAYQKESQTKAATINPMADTAMSALQAFKNELFEGGNTENKLKGGARGNIIESNIDFKLPIIGTQIKSPFKSSYETELNNLLEVLGRTLTPGNRAPSADIIKRLKETYFPGSLQDEASIKKGIQNMELAIENSRYIKPTTETADILASQ